MIQAPALLETVTNIELKVQDNTEMIDGLVAVLKGEKEPERPKDERQTDGGAAGEIPRDIRHCLPPEFEGGGTWTVTIKANAGLQWRNCISLPPGTDLTIRSGTGKRAKIEILGDGCRLAMSSSSSLRISGCDITAADCSSSTNIITIVNSTSEIGTSHIRFRDVTFQTKATVVEVGGHLCDLTLVGCLINGGGSLHSDSAGLMLCQV